MRKTAMTQLMTAQGKSDWMQKWHFKVKLLENSSGKEGNLLHMASGCAVPSYDPSDPQMETIC